MPTNIDNIDNICIVDPNADCTLQRNINVLAMFYCFQKVQSKIDDLTNQLAKLKEGKNEETYKKRIKKFLCEMKAAGLTGSALTGAAYYLGYAPFLIGPVGVGAAGATAGTLLLLDCDDQN